MLNCSRCSMIIRSWYSRKCMLCYACDRLVNGRNERGWSTSFRQKALFGRSD